MHRSTVNFWVGIFVALGIGGLMFLTFKVGSAGRDDLGATYYVVAKFDNVGGLKARAPVKCAGVVVGRVRDISFDVENFRATAVLDLSEKFKFPEDTFATINTSGLLGEQYIGLEVGGSEKVLQPGGIIKKTQSAVVLEKLISQFLYSAGARDSGGQAQ